MVRQVVLMVLLAFLLVNNYRNYSGKASDNAAAAAAEADVSRRAPPGSDYFDAETDDDAFGEDDEFGDEGGDAPTSKEWTSDTEDEFFDPPGAVAGGAKVAGFAVNRVKVLFCTA